MKILHLSISKKEALRFSKITKDKNPIHVDSQTGLNSIFRKNISHGVLLVLKILNKINDIKFILSCNYSFSIIFIKPIHFYEKILVKYKLNFSSCNFNIEQNNQKICSIEIKEMKKNIKKIQNFNLNEIRKFFFLGERKNPVFKFRNELENLQNLLCRISFFVGMIKPGKNGILNSIEINKSNKIKSKFTKILINTKKIDRRYKLYNNDLFWKNYKVRFISSERPEYKIINHQNNKIVKKIINKINKDIIIISGSSGLGESFLNIVKANKKIKIISTYSTIKPKNIREKNIIFKKISLPEDLSKLTKIIEKLNYPYVFYFTSPPINFGKSLSSKNKILYKEIFIKTPLNIVTNSYKNMSKFIYPSTSNIDYNEHSFYSKVKIDAEKKLKRFSSCYIYRFGKLYSKNTISLQNANIINLQKFLNQNPKLLYNFFK